MDSETVLEHMTPTVIDPFKPQYYTPEEVTAYQRRTDDFLDSIFNRTRNRKMVEAIEDNVEVIKEDCADGEICKNGYKYFETNIVFIENNFPIQGRNNNNINTRNQPDIGDAGDFSNDVFTTTGKYIGEMRGSCTFDERRTLHGTCLFTVVFFDKFGVEMGQLQFQGGGGDFLFEISDYVAGEEAGETLVNGLFGPQIYSVTGGTGCFSGADGQAVFTSTEKRFQVYLYRYWYHQYYYYNY